MGGMIPNRATGSSVVTPVVPGNINLNNRPIVHNADGSISTVKSVNFDNADGTSILIPTVTDEGKILPPRDALKYWSDKKQHLGIFKNRADAEKYAEQLHKDQEKKYAKKGK